MSPRAFYSKEGKMDRAALIGRLNGVMLTLFDSWEAEDDEAEKREFVRARETVNDAITTLESDRTEIARLEKIEARAQSFRVSRNFHSDEINNVTHFILTGDTDG